MLCLTRWIEKIDSMHRFREAFSAVMKTYDTIQMNLEKNWNSPTCVDAQGLYRACGNFEFIMMLVIVERVFAVTRDATVILQDREIDLFTAYKEVRNVRAALTNIRENVDKYHAEWFGEAKKMAANVGVSPTKRRICNIQRNRENYDSPDCQTYYQCAATIPFLDHVINQIDQQFTATTEKIVEGFVLIPSELIARIEKDGDGPASWKNSVMKIVNDYRSDFPYHFKLPAEMEIYEAYWLR